MFSSVVFERFIIDILMIFEILNSKTSLLEESGLRMLNLNNFLSVHIFERKFKFIGAVNIYEIILKPKCKFRFQKIGNLFRIIQL
jgi:hypothetical protein